MNTQTRRDFILTSLLAASACWGKEKEDGAGGPGDTGQPAGQATMSSQKPPATSSAPLADLDKLIDLAVAEANQLPRAEFDIGALAATLGKNPQALFDWVREHTWWAPYRGLLRGAKGVILDRVGGNLDRAVLLGELLRRAGHTVRLANAQLPEARARDLLAKVRPVPGQRYAAPAPRQLPVEQRRKAEALFPDLEQRLQEQRAETQRLSVEGRAIMRSQTDWLAATLRNRQDKAGARTDDRQAIAAMQDHWWVERWEADKWIPLDALPEATIGSAPVPADSVAEWNADDQLPALPAGDWHTVQLRIVIERYDDGTITEHSALETTIRPAEVIGQPIYLVHLPKPWPDALADPKTDPNALGNAAVGVRDWVPALRVGDKHIVQSGFTETGDLKADPFSAQSQISGAAGGSLFGGFDDALSGGAAGATSHVTAEWIDYEIRVPGDVTQRIRRPVFDVLGPVNRAEKVKGFDPTTNDILVKRYEALLSRIDILLQPCDFSEGYVTDLFLAGFVMNQEEIRKLAREPDAVKARALAAKLLTRVNLWGPLPVLVLWRSLLGGSSPGWFVDRPNILNYRFSRAVVNADKAPYRESIDIVSNTPGVANNGERPFDIRLRQGVADTVAEMLTLGGSGREVENTARLFAKIANTTDRSVIISPRDVDAVRDLAWPDDVAARLTDDVLAGFAAVATREPVELDGRERLGWWRVDPISGQTIGVMDNGFHDAMAEKQVADEVARTNVAATNWAPFAFGAPEAEVARAALWIGAMLSLFMIASAI